MTPFQEFRLWARRAPVAERTFAGLAAAVVLAVLAWVVLPTTSSTTGDGVLRNAVPSVVSSGVPTTGPSGGGAAAGGRSSAASAGTASGSGGGGASGPAGHGATTGTARTRAVGAAPRATVAGMTCPFPSASAPGVTKSQIKIAVMLPDIAGPAANSAFGVPSPDKMRKWYQDVVDSINASGGVACRKIVPSYYNVNPADQNDLQQKCLDVAQSGVFVVLDEGGYGPFPQKECYAQHHLPFFTGYPITGKEAQKFYPYLFSSATYETIYRNTAFALRDRGFFSPAKGFAKLGFVYNSCYRYLITDMLSWLHQAGVPDSKIVPYDMGCSSTTMPNPSDVQQAVLKFERAGVTHVTTAEFVGGFWMFTRAAEQQRFRPKYGIPDDDIVAISYGSNSPDANNISGAIAITPFRNGEEMTPGYRPSAGTVACNAIHAKYGEPPVYKQAAAVGGMACNELWIFKAALEHAPALSQVALAAGLQSARSIDMSYPQGPGDWSGNHNTAWMNYWRVDQFVTACKCWRVAEPNFHPSYR